MTETMNAENETAPWNNLIPHFPVRVMMLRMNFIPQSLVQYGNSASRKWYYGYAEILNRHDSNRVRFLFRENPISFSPSCCWTAGVKPISCSATRNRRKKRAPAASWRPWPRYRLRRISQDGLTLNAAHGIWLVFSIHIIEMTKKLWWMCLPRHNITFPIPEK